MNKRYIIAVWFLVLVLLYRWATYTYGGFQTALLLLLEWVVHHPLGILLYCGLYLIRPFTLLPVGWLSTLAGVFWGWRPGLAIALGGEMLSACVAFQNGRLLGPQGLLQKKEESFAKFSFILLRYPILAVVLSRMSPLPDDVVNYGRGMLRISWFTYFWGSVLGNLLFSVLNIVMGIQIDPETILMEGLGAGVDRPIFIFTFCIYIVVLSISRYIFKKVTAEEKQ